MVLVDTSIWVDFFNKNLENEEKLENLIKENNQVLICGLVLQEVLQGIKITQEFRLAKERLLKLPFIRTTKQTYLLAAEVYRSLRKQGLTIPSVDATIAAIALENDLSLFTKDEHLSWVAKHYPGLILY